MRVGRSKLWSNANFQARRATLNAKSECRTFKTVNAHFQPCRATLNAKCECRMLKTVVKCKFSTSPRNRLGISCVSDAQNCGKMEIFYLVATSWGGELFRNCGEMRILGRTLTSWGGLLPRVSVFSLCVCVSKSVSKIHDQQIMHVPHTCHDSLSNTRCF